MNPREISDWITGIVVVYSITDHESFQLAAEIIETLRNSQSINSGCILLVGNKNDLCHLREVSKEEAKQLVLDTGVQYIECSVAENFHEIQTAFTRLLIEVLLVQQARKISGELYPEKEYSSATDYEKKKIHRRSLSVPSSSKIMALGKSFDHDGRAPSPSIPLSVRQRKASLRKKISGILVGGH